MSQAGIIEFESAHPNVPTSFVTDNGTAVPIANVLEILGTIVPNHHIPLETTGSGNTVTVVTQYAAATVATTTTDAGLASFNNAQFTVDANGFVSIIGGTGSIEKIGVDADTPPGTNPVLPDGTGKITVTGGQVASGTTPQVILTNSLNANSYVIQIQRSTAVAASDITKNGVSHFNSADFTVDGDGFVSFLTEPVVEFTVDAATLTGNTIVTPLSGNIRVSADIVTQQGIPIRTQSPALHQYNIETQYTDSNASALADKSGLAHFDEAAFLVDNTTGFVALSGGVGKRAITQVTVPNGVTPIQPDVTGNINFTSSGGTVVITGSSASPNNQTINFDISGGKAAVEKFTVDEHTAPGTNPVLPDGTGDVTITGGQVAASTTPSVIQTNSLNANSYVIQIQRSIAVAASDVTQNGVSHFNSADFSVDANGFVSATGSVSTLYTENSGTATPSAGNLNILGPNSALTGYSPWTVGGGSTVTVNMPGTVKWVVNATANLGTHTTIQAAITAASSGDDIFITPGTYTENLTLKAGVNLTAYECDNGSQVIISGTCTFSSAGTAVITGIQLNTNSAPAVVVSGSAASRLTLKNCTLEFSNNTGMIYSSSNASSNLALINCVGDLGTTGIAIYTHTSAGQLYFDKTEFSNSGGSSTASTASGLVGFYFSVFSSPFSISSGSIITGFCYEINTSGQNVACITTSGTATGSSYFAKYSSGTASCISIGSGTMFSMYGCALNSTNANAFTGAGTANYSMLSYQQTAVNNNVTTPVINPGSAFQSVVVQTFTSSGTYTPTAGMKYCQIEVVGGGGGGGGSASTVATQASVGSGGGGGGYSKGVFTAATIGSSQTVTIAAAAAGGVGNSSGSSGGTCSVGALITALGGTGGQSTSSSTTPISNGGIGATPGSGGSLNSNGSSGTYAFAVSVLGLFPGSGGDSVFGAGGRSSIAGFGASASNGNAGLVYGGGGAGASSGTNSGAGSAAANGGAGAKGIVIITEYV